MQRTIYFTDKEDRELGDLEIAQGIPASSVVRALIAEKWARMVDMGLIKVETLPHPDGAQSREESNG